MEDRRDNHVILQAIGELKNEMTDRLARIETKQEALAPRCDSHAEDIQDLDDRTTVLENDKSTVIGAAKTFAWGVPAVGSAAWFLYMLLKDLTGRKL